MTPLLQTSMMFPTADLPSSDLFRYVPEHLTVSERINLSHERAKAIGLRYKLTIDDVLQPTQKFWNMYRDYAVTLDGAAVALFSIQLNLAAGTLAPFVKQRPELQSLLDDMLTFRVSAQFLLTELGHGLDAPHLETSAVMQTDGSFIIHTPNARAAKFMPPTLPFGGVPRVGILFARLAVRGEDRGIRPFIVPLNDGKSMCKGITARELPTRVGSRSFGHALTYFDNVRLAPSALLGSPQKVDDERAHFLKMIWRVGIGSLSLTSTVPAVLKLAAYITATYSKRRCVTGPRNQLIPIISFRTQQIPILHAMAQGFVLDSFYQQATKWFSEISPDNVDERNAIAAIVKATMIGHWRRTGCTLADRCGAQGMFDCNQITSLEMELRGAAIAEGDVLVLALRLVPELLLNRYSVPCSQDPNSLLSQHERGLSEEMMSIFKNSGEHHRGDFFNRMLLPRCLPLVEAIGQRMALEATVEAGVPEPLVRLYEIGAVGTDLGWYNEHGLITRSDFLGKEDTALSDVYSHLQDYLDMMDIAPYAVAAITSDASWEKFEDSLKVHKGNAAYSPLPSEMQFSARL
ncbi:hypothetical protein QCA50_011900 [Cerrena zonata]|uniref:Acyl-CoA oxidase C-alpha1 domain-containing protein n=1 Tax=Cerrena zonata TaxID=2478898 RepID=A0AAW0FVG3_9APHY